MGKSSEDIWLVLEKYEGICFELQQLREAMKVANEAALKSEADAAMWRDLCQARAMQLNEAYNTMAVLRTEVRDLTDKADGLQDALDDLWADMQVTK